MRIPKADVLRIARDLDHSKGRILETLERIPELTSASRDLLEHMYGTSIRAFRTVMVPERELVEPEGIVSSTLNPLAAVRLAMELPGVRFTSEKVVVRNPTILRYDLPLDRVLAFMPAVIELAAETWGEELETMRFRGVTGPTTVAQTFLEVLRRQEDEAIIDARGLSPAKLVILSRMDIFFAEKVVSGKFTSGVDHIIDLKQYLVETGDPVGAAQFYEVEAAKLRRFFFE